SSPSIFPPRTFSRFATARFTKLKPWASRCRTTPKPAGNKPAKRAEANLFACLWDSAWSSPRPRKPRRLANRSAILFQKGHAPASQPLQKVDPVNAKPARAVPTKQHTRNKKENKQNCRTDKSRERFAL